MKDYYRIVLLCVLLAIGSGHFSQTLEELEGELVSLQEKEEEVKHKIENLKLDQIIEDLQGVGYPISDDNVEIVEHKAMILGYSEKHEQAAWEVAKAWKELYTEKGVETGYRFYSGGIGLDVPMFMIVRQASDKADLDAKRAAEQEKLGEAGGELWQKTIEVCRKIEVYNGSMRPDLSYLPEN